MFFPEISIILQFRETTYYILFYGSMDISEFNNKQMRALH